MAIGFNLGDEGRAFHQAEDAETNMYYAQQKANDFEKAFRLTTLALEAVLAAGEGIVLDARSLVDRNGVRLIPDQDWFYLAVDAKKGITPYTINGRPDLKHGDRLRGIPRGL